VIIMATIQELAEPAHTVTWCPGCVLPGSLIQKNPSIGKIEDIKAGDLVLGSDGKYHKVTEVFAHRHTGKMYQIKSKCLGQVSLTDEHPVLSVKRKNAQLHNEEFELNWVRADQLKKGDYVAYPILKEEEDLEAVELPNLKRAMDRKSKPFPSKIRISEEFLLLCGYYLAEGHVHNREITFTFNSKEKQFVDDVRKCTEKVFGLPTTVKTRASKNTTEVFISSSQLARHFEEWFGTGAAKKKIPRFLMLLPKEKQKWLIRGMWRGDGWVGKGRANYRTISHVLSEQLKNLLIRHQIVPTISVGKAKGMHKESYSIQIVSRRDLGVLSQLLDIPIEMRASGKPPSSILLTEYVLTPIREIEVFDYDGIVHNMEVEGVHSYVSENAILHNCGDFAILVALKGALAKLNRQPHETVVVSGIGCGSKLPHFIKTYGYEGLHGRALPAASAIKLANHSLEVVTVGGDGDGYGIGMGHFIHTCRRNIKITCLMLNNEVYGMTGGQVSPTTSVSMLTTTTPLGNSEPSFDACALATAAGAGFVGREVTHHVPKLTELIKAGLEHPGFAFIEVLSDCTEIFGRKNELGSAAEMVLRQKSDLRPSAYRDTVEAPFRANELPTGLLSKNDRPEYGAAYRKAAAAAKAAAAEKNRQ